MFKIEKITNGMKRCDWIEEITREQLLYCTNPDGLDRYNIERTKYSDLQVYKSCHRDCYFNKSENRKEKLEKLKNYEHNKD